MLFITIVIWRYVPASYFVARSRSQITKGAKNTRVRTILFTFEFYQTESKRRGEKICRKFENLIKLIDVMKIVLHTVSKLDS